MVQLLIEVGKDDFGWPDRVRSTGRVAKRQEAAPSGFKRPKIIPFAECGDVPVPIQLVADDEASCRFATPPPWQDGGAPRPGVAR